MRFIEAHAAIAYWRAWKGVRPTFVTRDRDAVPAHWTRFTQRVSLLTGTPRVATDPICATLNYLYSILEAESRIALSTLGLDAGIGILHTDQPARDSLALDLMEAVRPAVDAYVLDLLAERSFSSRDVQETQAGQCRLLPRLARELAQTASTWATHVAPHAELVANRLARASGLPRPATSLTGSVRRAAQPAHVRKTGASTKAPRRPHAICADCGHAVSNGNTRCIDCHTETNETRLREMASTEAARRRHTGDHPQHRAEVRAKMADRQREHWQARKDSGEVGGWTGHPSEFRRLILPKLAAARPSDLARATGLSPGYCALIRDGKRVPHVRHWAALRLIAT
jgi:hypothetical protein